MGRCRFSALFLAILLPTMAHAQGKSFKVGVEDLDYYPYYAVKAGKYGGFAEALLTRFAKKKGYTFEYRPLPVNRLFQSLVNKSIDFKFPDHHFWQQDIKKGAQITYSEPVVDFIDGVMVKPENKGKGADKLKVLGTVRGFTAWDYLDSIKAGKVKVTENNNFRLLLEQTVMGRVDGAYINVTNAKHLLEKELAKPNALVFDEALPHTKSAYLLSTANHPEVIKEFNEYLKEDHKGIAELKKSFGIDL